MKYEGVGREAYLKGDRIDSCPLIDPSNRKSWELGYEREGRRDALSRIKDIERRLLNMEVIIKRVKKEF